MNGSKVLIVDDNSSMRDLIKNALMDEGFIVAGEAENGEEAINMYKEYNPDIVTMDISMPEMDGIEATKKIIEYDKNAKIIIVTEDYTKEEAAELAGASDYLTKPFQPAFLWRKIDNLLGNDNESQDEDESMTIDEEDLYGDDFEFEVSQDNNPLNEKIEIDDIDSNIKDDTLIDFEDDFVPEEKVEEVEDAFDDFEFEIKKGFNEESDLLREPDDNQSEDFGDFEFDINKPNIDISVKPPREMRDNETFEDDIENEDINEDDFDLDDRTEEVIMKNNENDDLFSAPLLNRKLEVNTSKKKEKKNKESILSKLKDLFTKKIKNRKGK